MSIRGKAFIAGAFEHPTRHAPDKSVAQLHMECALGAVAEKAILVPDAAKALVGTKVDEAALDKLAEVASAACRPISDKRGTKEFRIKVAGVLAKRTAAIALQRAKGGAK